MSFRLFHMSFKVEMTEMNVVVMASSREEATRKVKEFWSGASGIFEQNKTKRDMIVVSSEEIK